MYKLLTDTVVEAILKKQELDSYGVSIINLPDMEYSMIAKRSKRVKKLEFYFLGFSNEKVEKLKKEFEAIDGISYSYTVEEAEKSRNTGAEDIFRIHIVKNQELEKISSLRWYDTIDMDQVYIESCKYVLNKLTASNTCINNLLNALKRQDIRSILNFERVLSYLETLLDTPPEKLPNTISGNLYMLGLLSSSKFSVGNPSIDDFRLSIKHNHDLVRRISSLEQKERQNITSYSAQNPEDKIVKLILSYYRKKDINLLREMDFEEVAGCLKNISLVAPKLKTTPRKNNNMISPTAAAAQLAFDQDMDQIEKRLDEITEKIDNRDDRDKRDVIDIEFGDSKVQIGIEPSTEILAKTISTEQYWGGVVYADVKSPKDALESMEKYDVTLFDSDYINERIFKYLENAGAYLGNNSAANDICLAFTDLIDARKKILPFGTRLQDAPMLQVLCKHNEFQAYLYSYERLLSTIKDNYSILFDIDYIGAKDIMNTIMSLDFLYIVGDDYNHAVPTPLNPLYLWKYIKLAQEILETNQYGEGQELNLSEEDKAFIIRKSEDVPDPLALILLPNSIISSSECLPIAGKIGCMPVYSTNSQINEGDTGMDAVKQGIIRYMCLYPHASLMLRISFINPPTVEAVIDMLKRLERDKEFSAFGKVGIDLSIYRTKEAPAGWVKIEDKSLNDGILGRYRGKSTSSFNLSIVNKTLCYDEILGRIKKEQHLTVIFDPNEKKVDLATNNRQIHIHPLCVPKVYEYNRIQGTVRTRAANEGSVFADYAVLIEKLHEQPSSYRHRNVFVQSPLTYKTYCSLLDCSDWLIILDQNLKSWDIMLKSSSEKLYYRSNAHRSVGIYTKNSNKFILGYRQQISRLGNYVPNNDGLSSIINTIRSVNDDGLLSIVSHSTNSIFDMNHGKGSLGLAIAAIDYMRKYPEALLVGLDTQLARAWLSDREEGKLPDLIGLRFSDKDTTPNVDIIEVKTYQDYSIYGKHIQGHAVEQILELEHLLREMFGKNEKITTVARKEILREQVFECLFHSNDTKADIYDKVEWLNKLFAGECGFGVTRSIYHVDFESPECFEKRFYLKKQSAHEHIGLIKIGSSKIQATITNEYYENNVATYSHDEEASASKTYNDNKNNVNTTQKIKNAHIESCSKKKEAGHMLNDEHFIREKCIRLNLTLKGYGIKATPIDVDMVQQAARFTRFKIELMPGESIRKLRDKSQDIARELEANGDIFIDNIVGTRYVGMDVPFIGNADILSLIDNLHRLDICEGDLDFLAGQAPDGQYQIIDLAKAPHLLVAGTTGSGKTVFLYSIIVSLLHRMTSDELEFLLIDPKQTDFHFFEDLKHIRGNRVLTDANESIEALEIINKREKEERTRVIKQSNSRDIDSYNKKNPNQKLKRLVIIIDEYADLVKAAELQGKKVKQRFETNLCMLAQRVRNLGIHLVIATQQPRATIVTSTLKAVLPYRASFRLPSHVDSQTILDRSGAEDLLGRGDMLLMTESDLIRMQGFHISEEELIYYVGSQLNCL